jgi:hypothetical protein
MKELSVALERSVAVPITFSSKNKTMMKYEGRVEYIPVEWHEAFALQSRRTPVAAKQRELASFATTHVKDSPCQMICKPYSKWMKQISTDDSKSDEDRDSIQKLIFDLAAINFNKKHDRTQLNGSDGEFQQVLNSVKQLTAEIASLSEGFHDLLNSQITYYQKCNSLQDSFQQLTAEIASLS